MSFASSPSSLSATPNVTPLIDVLLVLLIIFMVIVPLTPRGLESVIPDTSSTSALPHERPLLVQVLPSGVGTGILYRVDGIEIDPGHLRDLLVQRQSETASRSLLVDGDPSLDYQPIANTVAEGRLAGFKSIGLLPRSAHNALAR
ncbi:MAG TPA: biopolymer transporter ExbD [Acidobacteriaceae bacterium]|nr:biopolymer transporter ExbD [Acidobacteriaceae bacterium]